MRLPRLLAALVIALTPARSFATDISGTAEIIDGDTLRINGAVVDLWGVDAPEPEQPCHVGGVAWACGDAATDHIRAFTIGQSVSCALKPGDIQTEARYKCAVGTLDIGAEMIEVGLALPYWPVSARYYLRSYQEARGQGRGMHKGSFEAPWKWRQGRPVKIAPAK